MDSGISFAIGSVGGGGGRWSVNWIWIWIWILDILIWRERQTSAMTSTDDNYTWKQENTRGSCRKNTWKLQREHAAAKKLWQNNGVEALDEWIASLSIVHKIE